MGRMSGWKGLIMFKQIKSVLKKFIPPPVDVFNREINRSIRHSEKQTKIIADLVKQSDKQNSKKLSDLANAVEQINQTDKQNAKKLSEIVNAVEQLKKENKEYKSKLMKLESDIRLVLIPLSILNLETNTIKTQNKQQLEVLMKLARQLDEDSKNQMIQPVEPDE
jgi:chromosome segregation ATPase